MPGDFRLWKGESWQGQKEGDQLGDVLHGSWKEGWWLGQAHDRDVGKSRK